MWPFTRVPKALPKRWAELEAELGDVEITLAWIKKQLLDMNGRLSTVQRQQKRDQAALEETNGTEDPQYHEDLTAPPRHPVPRGVESTAHLARRFRGF